MRANEAEGVLSFTHFRDEFLWELPASVLILDRDHRITYANRASRELIGRERGAPLIGLTIERLASTPPEGISPVFSCDPASTSRIGDLVDRVLASGRPMNDVRLELDRPHLSRRFLSLQAIPVHTEMGGLAGVGLVISDVSEQEAQRSEGEWLREELLASRMRVENLLRLSEELNSIGRTIHSTLDFDEVLRSVVGQAALAVGATSGAIAVLENGRWVMRVVFNLPEEMLGRSLDPDEARHATIAAEERKAFAVADITRDDRLDEDVLRTLGVKSVLAVPVFSPNEPPFALSFHTPEITEFAPEQIDFAAKVATTTALAMENARVYTEERHIADTLQQALLVVPKRIDGIEFQHLYQSATQAAWVGGDFFDLFKLPDSRIGVLIGDVAGKGVEASALASFTRQLVKAHAQEESSPARVLARTNDLVFRSSRTDDFVTVFFGLLSLEDGSLTFCNAGHPAPIVLSDSTHMLAGGGPIIGAWPDLEYHDERTSLGIGDTLVLYTDGVTEAKRDGELFGDERLLASVQKLRSAPLVDVPDGILRDVSAFSRGRLWDDLALLTLRRLP